MSTNGLSYWQAESEGINLLDLTIGDLFQHSTIKTLARYIDDHVHELQLNNEVVSKHL